MKRNVVIILCNESRYAADPWVRAGYIVYIVDPLHPAGINSHRDTPNLRTVGAVIAPDTQMPNIPDCLNLIGYLIRSDSVAMVMGFPPCTHLASSGARHWKSKFNKDRYFQAKAAMVLEQCRMIGALSGAPWMFENPVGAASSIMGKSAFSFNPCDYGGYLPPKDQHPDYPKHIPPRDAYQKRTHIWSGNGFRQPKACPVQSLAYYPGWKSLGGASARTKKIRSATPRGFAIAVFEAHAQNVRGQRPP